MRTAALALVAAFAGTAPALAACPDIPTVARFAQALIERRVPEPFPDLTANDARCAQNRLVATLAQPWGDVEGCALAAEALPPLRGALFHATLRARSGATVAAQFGARPAVAPGVLLRIGRGGVERAAPAGIAAHVAAASPYLALLDLAAMPGEADRTTRIAGNLGLRLGVVGEALAITGGAIPGTAATLQADGSVLASLDHLGLAAPVRDLLAGLARDLAAEGRALREGEHVALLAAPARVAPRPGETWRLAITGLGAVVVNFR